MSIPKQIIINKKKHRSFISFPRTREMYFEVVYQPEDHNGLELADFSTGLERPNMIIQSFSTDGHKIFCVRYIDGEITEEEVIDWVRSAFK